MVDTCVPDYIVKNLKAELAKCQQQRDGLAEALEKVEWIFDIEDDGYRSCPWCHGLDPHQHEVAIHSESMNVTIGHTNDCLRQAASVQDKPEE